MSASIQEFDFSVTLLDALLWRNNNAPNIQSILQQKSDWYETNVTEYFENWITDVFDLRTANEFGLSIWALILGVPLSLIVAPNQGPQFGFGPSADGRQNFGNGNFGTSTAGVGLTLEQKRILLRLTYYKLISRCTVPEVNAALKGILGSEGGVYLLDGNDMTYATYVFGFTPSSALKFILENFDVLPRPSGVGVRYIVSTRPAFGFGAYNQNFNNGTFWAED